MSLVGDFFKPSASESSKSADWTYYTTKWTVTSR